MMCGPNRVFTLGSRARIVVFTGRSSAELKRTSKKLLFLGRPVAPTCVSHLPKEHAMNIIPGILTAAVLIATPGVALARAHHAVEACSARASPAAIEHRECHDMGASADWIGRPGPVA